MHVVRQWLTKMVIGIIAAVVAVAPAFAQGTTTSSISGTVVDNGGGVIPGATVVVSNAAGNTFNTITNGEGAFSIPALTPGTYKVTVTLSGFKTAVTDNVRVISGNPASIKVTLQIGTLSETVTVKSSSELINTQTATVSSTLDADQLNRMPTQTRNALNAVTFLPGVNTASTNRNSTVNGLPDSMVNITLDGVSNNDNFNRNTDGFFASVTPRQDAVEAVTVTSAVAGANQGGSGAVSINFTTRSGTNQYSGSVYDYWRDPRFNSNYWFNERNGLEKNDVKLYQFGSRFGGPIRVPGLYDGAGKAFFFVHYEQVRFPNSFTRTRTANHPDTMNGLFRYNAGTTTAPDIRSVNVMALAAANGQISAFNPLVMNQLRYIDTATRSPLGTLAATADPQLNSFVWQSPGKLFEDQPTVRIDVNLGAAHRLSGSAQRVYAERDPDYLNNADARFPGAPNFETFSSSRPLYSVSLRSTILRNVVNELRGGLTSVHGFSAFGQPDDPSSSIASFADLGGYAINLGLGTNWWLTNNPGWRAAPTYSLENSMNWLRGSHSFNVGGAFLRSRAWDSAQQLVPGITLGFNTANDPANGMFNTTNFPGASAAQLTNARAVYAMLTGRVSAVTGQAALDPDTNQYVAFGPRRREGRLDTYSLYAQDSWRIRPTLTLTGGLRWDLQQPYTALNDTMSAVEFPSVCGLSGLGDGSTYNKCAFNSRATGGVTPQYVQFSSGTKGYNTDWNNLSPSLSVAWRPNVQSGWLRTMLGDPEQATIRGGYSVSYERQGLGAFSGVYGGNPGSTIALSRNANTGLVPAGESWPVLLSETSRLYQQAFPATVTYPIAVRPDRADSISAFAPDLQVASARSWTVGLQRSISRDMAVDIRYVGTRGVDQWSSLNYNTRDIEGNGFIDEFKLAVANLQANNAAGGTRAGSFRYFGPGTGTNPLPIYLAYLNQSTDALNVSAYTGTDWTNTAITQDMIFVNPSPTNAAADLDGDLTRRNRALAAGLPANFFVLNPAVNAVNVTDSGAYSDFHALQVDLRRRLARGLSSSVNYQYATEGGSAFRGFRYGRVMNPVANVRHAFKTQWDWEIPVGRGQRFGTNMNAWLDGALGGWSFRGVGRVQAATVDFGNVRLVGMSAKELQSMYRHDIRIDPSSGLRSVYMLPDDVILNTRRAFSLDPGTVDGYSTALGAPAGRYIAPANRPDCIQLKAGDCAPRTLLIRAPWFSRFDVGLSKKFRVKGTANIETAFEVLNLFDTINFNNVSAAGAGATIFQTTAAYTDPSNSYDPGGRLGQLMFRFSW
jgi:Carboxypeptidase regulatory-like domain/TonB dependent receptor/TonB-dependent Receptor Plug Domain